MRYMFCPNCGKEQEGSPNYCINCGAEFSPDLSSEPMTSNSEVVEYAGWWERPAAYVFDAFLLSICFVILFLIIGFIPEPASAIIWLTTIIIVPWLYYAIMESSHKQSTLGKIAVGIIVTDYKGNRISFGRATGRHFAKIISVLILYIGLIMFAFTEKKQCLHDILAGCLVVKK